MISQMGDVEQKSVVRRQATTGHILQYSDPRTLPDPVLVNVPLREAESPVYLKAASSLSRRYHLEPSILLVPLERGVPRPLQTSTQPGRIRRSDQQVDVRQWPLPQVIVQIEQIAAAFQQDEWDSFCFDEPAEGSKIRQGGESIQHRLAMGALQGGPPAPRQRACASFLIPEGAKIPSAFEPPQTGLRLFGRHFVLGRLAVKQRQNRTRDRWAELSPG